jgi:Protein of unknown function (DUF2563)
VGELTGKPAIISLTSNSGGHDETGAAMFVDTGLLHSGGNESHRAGGHAQEGADRLSRGPLMSGMFGQFDAAEAFHGAVSTSHAQHVRNLQAHQEVLTSVGAKAHLTAKGFREMDERNAAEERAVRWNSGIST